MIKDILYAFVTITSIFVAYYLSTLRNIDHKVVDAINEAETTKKSGDEKMSIAIESVYSIVPLVLKPLITRDIIQILIQYAFDKIELYVYEQKK